MLRTGGVVLAGGAIAHALPAPGTLGFHSHGSDAIRVGLVGCGGRGTGAASQALRADPRAKLVAAGDVFMDQVDRSLAALASEPDVAERAQVGPERRFAGFDAYARVIDECDVVLLASTPHFRPEHVEYAARAGKHMFVEKPVAVDAPGVRRVMAAMDVARSKRLSVVAGLCYRYERKKRETVRRIHDGALGRIVAAQCTYDTGGLWHRGRRPEWSDVEWQIRNWLYFTWLSGDHIVEQHIHSLDKIAWALGDRYPVSATGSGGRSQRLGAEYGNVYDHFNTVFEFDDGVRLFSSCRQWTGAASDVSDHVWGTRGVAHLQQHSIEGESPWAYRAADDAGPDHEGPDDMYQNEHDALFESIRSGTPIDDGVTMCNSTLMAILGRMAAYTGQKITWQQALASQENLAPPEYLWGELAVAPVAVPGVTPFV